MKFDSIRKQLHQKRYNRFTSVSLLEFILLTAFVPVSGYWFNPTDPFFIKARFPILLLPPLLIALRYGLALGMTCFGVLLLGTAGAEIHATGQLVHFPTHLLFGIMLVTLITGEMTNISSAKIRHIEAKNKFLMMRFDEFTNAYHVIKVSHDQLKEQLANTNFSLREALQMVREKLKTQYRQGHRGLSPQVAGELLSIFNYFCSTQIAGVYKVTEDNAIEPEPLAVQGNLGRLKLDDPLIQKALCESSMVSVLPEMYTHKSEAELETDLLAVIPIKDISGVVWGIVVVAEMHFSAFQDENLQLMQLIGAYSGDLFSQADNTFYTNRDKPVFTNELKNCWRMAEEFGIRSSLICITFHKAPPSDELLSTLAGRIRNLDHAWVHCSATNIPVIFQVMMFMTTEEYQSYCDSLNLFLQESCGSTLEDIGGVLHHLEINAKHDFSEYVQFISDVTHESACLPALNRNTVKTNICRSIPDRTRRVQKKIRMISIPHALVPVPAESNQ